MRWDDLSAPQQINLEQYLASLRNEILLAQAKSQEISLAAYDRVKQQVEQLTKVMTEKDVEIKRLQELCDKNKIDTIVTPKVKPSKWSNFFKLKFYLIK